jgi:hypothetical protein
VARVTTERPDVPGRPGASAEPGDNETRTTGHLEDRLPTNDLKTFYGRIFRWPNLESALGGIGSRQDLPMRMSQSNVSAVSNLDHQRCQVVDNHTNGLFTPIDRWLPLPAVLVLEANTLQFHHVMMML